MNLLKGLHEHLIAQKHHTRDKLDSWAEQGSLQLSGEVLSTFDQSQRLFNKHYLAVYSLEGFTGDANQLFIDVMSWLVDQKYDFDELGWPEFDVTPDDQDAADVEISIWFEEPVYTALNVEGKQAEVEPEVVTAEDVEPLETADFKQDCSSS